MSLEIGEEMEKECVTVEETKPRFYYGYVIVALSFIAMVAGMGIRGSFGTYVTGWEETFSVNRVWVSIVPFISSIVYGVSVFFAGRLSDKIGPRKVLIYSMILLSTCLLGSYFSSNIIHMMLLYGVIGSIGFGFASNVTVSVGIVRWFKEKKGLMISIVVVGMAVGPMLYGPLNIYLIEAIGWKWLFVIYGGIYCLLFLPLFFFFYRDFPEHSHEYSKTVKKLKPTSNQTVTSVFSIFQYPITWVICLTYVICGFTDIGLINTHLVPLGENRGYSSSILGNAMILYGVSNIIGTLLIGFASDKFSNQKLLSLLFLIRVCACLLLITAEQPVWLLFFALLYGFTDIATIAPFTMICSKIFGEKQMGSAFGLISSFHQFGAAVGSLVPGLLFSVSLNYQSTLWLSTGLLVLNAIIILNVKEQKKISLKAYI